MFSVKLQKTCCLVLLSISFVLALNPTSQSRWLTDSPTCKNITTISGSGSTCLNVSSSEFQYQSCSDSQPYCDLNPLQYHNGATCSVNQQVTQAQVNLPNGSACSTSSECLSQNCSSLVCTQGTLANGQACNHPQQCSSTTCFNGTCKESVKLGQECQAGQCSSTQKCLQLNYSYPTSGTCQAQITSGSCLYHNQCADGYYCSSSNICTSYPTTAPASCSSQYECPSNKYCDYSSNTCQDRISDGPCNFSNPGCIRSEFCSFDGNCKTFFGHKICSYNIQCQSGLCQDGQCLDISATGSCGLDDYNLCSGSNYCHPSAPQNVQTFNTCQFPIPGTCTSDDDCSSTQYCDSSSGCTDLKDPDTACSDDKECKGLCLTGSCKAIGSLSLGEEAGGKYKLCKSGYIPASQTTCGSLSRSSSQSFFCDTANKCDYTDNNGNTVQLDCRCGGNGATPSFNGHCPNYRGTSTFQSLIEFADDLGVLKQEHFDDPSKLGVPLIGIDKTDQKNLFTSVRFHQVLYPNIYLSDELFGIKNDFQNAPRVSGITQALDLLNTKQYQDWASSILKPDNDDVGRVFLSNYMTNDEFDSQVNVFSILLSKTTINITDFTTEIKSLGNKYVNLTRYTCDNTFKVYQVVANLHKAQVQKDLNDTQVYSLFQNLLNKGSDCSQNTQMLIIYSQIVIERINKQTKDVSINSSVLYVTKLFLTIPQLLRDEYAHWLIQFYSAFLFKVDEDYTSSRSLQQQGQLNSGSNICTLNQQFGFAFDKFSQVKDDLKEVKSGMDLAAKLDTQNKRAGFGIDFSPFTKHFLSEEISVQVKSNPGNSYPVLIHELSQSKCNDLGTLPQNGCGVEHQKPNEWGKRRSNPVAVAPVDSSFISSVLAESQFKLNDVSNFKPLCCARLSTDNKWVKLTTTPIRRSEQDFACQTNQSGIYSLIYYRKSGQDCIDLRQALDLQSKKMAEELIEQILKTLCRFPGLLISTPGYQCSNCFEWTLTLRKAAQILIDQRTSEHALRRQLIISFFYSMVCWCRSYYITPAQRAQIADNLNFYHRQICYSFWREYTGRQLEEKLRNLENFMRKLIEDQNLDIFHQMENVDPQLSKIRDSYTNNYSTDQNSLQLVEMSPVTFQNQSQRVISSITTKNLPHSSCKNKLQYFDTNTNTTSYFQIKKVTIIEPAEELISFEDNKSHTRTLVEYSLSAWGKNNKQLINGDLASPILVGTKNFTIQQNYKYQCSIFQTDENGVMTQNKENIKTIVDRQNGVLGCKLDQIGVVAINYIQVTLVSETVQIALLVTMGTLPLLLMALVSINLYIQIKNTTARIEKELEEQNGKSIEFFSKAYRPHFSIKKNCCQMYFIIAYYANFLTRWVLYFDSTSFGILLSLIKAAQIILRISLIALSIFYIENSYFYAATLFFATYSYSPLQSIFYWRSHKFECSELMHIISTGEKKTHRVNKFCAIGGIIAAMVISIAAFTVSGLQISDSIVEQSEFILRLVIPFGLILVFSLVQTTVLHLIYFNCKERLSPKNGFVKGLYEIFVARDVRLIFKDQDALKGDVCKHGKVAPVDSSAPSIVNEKEEEEEGQSPQENEESIDGQNNTVINTGRSDAPICVPSKGHQRFKTSMN